MKSVFITGGTTGLGFAMAKFYFDAGWRVAVASRNRSHFDDNFTGDYANISYFELDVTNRDNVKECISSFSKYGLDLVIANAGIGYAHKTTTPNFDYANKVLDVNIYGVQNTFEAALEYMIPKKSGHIVAVSSVAGFNGLPGVSAYSGSKACVKMICESLYLDLKRFDVDVTCICPGFVDTPLTRKNPHPMPFLMQADEAARRIGNAIEKKKMVYSFPFLFSTAVKILGMLPRPLYAKMMSSKRINYSVED